MTKQHPATRSTITSHTRRDFLQWTAGAGLAAAACGGPQPAPETARPAASAFSAPLGVELYTVRKQLPDQAEEVLGRLAEIGFVEIEQQWSSVKTMLPLLKSVGLHPISVAINPAVVTGDWAAAEAQARRFGLAFGGPESMDEIAGQAQEAGAEYLMFPIIQADDKANLDFYREFADKFNKAGEIATKHGLRICYHNHAFEFEPIGEQSPYDVMIEGFDPRLTAFEVDVFWVSISGHDPVELLKRLKGRVPMIHLKDLAKGAASRYNQEVAPEEFTEVGNGTVDFAAILRQAPDTGVKHYFVEQDQTPGDPIESLRQSYEYLRTLTV